jgi:glucosamine-6-phosphate deaminase
MLNFIITQSYEEMSALAARRVAKALARKPDLVMALPTGGTPVGLLTEMSRMAQEKEADFSRAFSFNIDEYIPLKKTIPRATTGFLITTSISMPMCRLRTVSFPTCWQKT